MPIVKKSIVNQMNVERIGLIGVRFALQVIEEELDNREIASQWHRMLIEPGDNVDAKFDELNAWLTANGYAGTVNAERNRVKSIAQVIHTAGVISNYQAWKAAQQAPGGGGA